MLKTIFKKVKYYTNSYRIYYRMYYYLFGRRTITKPKQVNPPSNKIICVSKTDPDFKKHHNFLYAQVKPLKWLFWKRKFAFQTIGNLVWYKMPKLTPWSYEDNITQFGLNSTFVKKHADEILIYATWI